MSERMTAGAGDRVWTLNTWLRYVATGADTEGRVAILEQRMTPAGDTPPHVHEREDEGFYVIDGKLRAQIGAETVTAGPGEFVFLPRQLAHSLHAETPEVRGLILVSPAGFEQLFAAVGTAAPTDELPTPAAPDVAALAQAAASYGVTVLPPEPAPA